MHQLTYAFDTDKDIPLYQQLYEFIKEDIREEHIRSGTKLPSKRSLAEHLQISQNTVQSAYNQLIEEGYLRSEERRGYYVKQIDWIQKIHVSPQSVQKTSELKKTPLLYDFAYHGVDHDSFPFNDWRKILRDSVDENNYSVSKFGDKQGDIFLREAIVTYLHQSRGVYCTADQIVISSSVMLLYQSLIQMFGRDTVFGIENPGYEKLDILFNTNNSKYLPISIDENGIMINEVEKSGVDIVCVTPSHQFPSGEVMTVNRRAQLLNWASKKETRYIIEDDYDSEFKYSTKPIPALQGMDTQQKVVYLGSFSKSLSPSIRISYMVLPNELMKTYHTKLSYSVCTVPLFMQTALYTFINEGYFERHLNKMRTIYKRKREILVSSLESAHHNMQILGTNAGLHLTLRVPNRMSENELISSAKDNGVGVYGVSDYYYGNTYCNPTTLLLGYAGIPEKDIPKAVNLLDSAWF